MSSALLDVPAPDKPCAFCDYISGRRPFTILARTRGIAVLVTREQRGIGHVLVVPIAHRLTLLDLNSTEATEIMVAVIDSARAITEIFRPRGIAVWQNNGRPANQMIPHAHFHVAGTLPDGGTEFGEVPELTVAETERIAEQLRPAMPDY